MAFSFFKIETPPGGKRHSRISSALVFLLCFIPCMGAVLFGAVDGITWGMITILTAVICILWAAEGCFNEALPFNGDALQLGLVALILVGLVQLLPLGPALPADLLPSAGRQPLSLDPYTTRNFIRNLVVFLIFLSSCLTFINSEIRIRKVGLVIIIFGALMAFYGILQHIADADAIYGIRKAVEANPFGPFVNQHHFAGFMEMTAGLTLGMIFGSSAKERKFLFGLAAVVMLAAIILTGSRGGLLSICGTAGFAGLLSFVYRARSGNKASEETGSKKPVAMGGLILALSVILLVLFLGGDESLTRGLGLTTVGDDPSNGRLHFWSVALQIFLDHPIIGAGLDAFGVAFTRYDTWNGFYRIEQAHNDYLQMLADGGILGLTCVFGFIFLLFKKSLRTISTAAVGMRRDIAIGSLAGCFGILLHSFVDFPLRTWSNSFFFLLLVACATVTVRAGEEVKTRRKRRTT